MKKYLLGFIFSYFWLLVYAHTDNSDSRTINQGEISKFIMFFLCFSRIPNWFLHLEIWTSLSVSIWITRTDMWRSIGISDIVWWLSHIQLTTVLLCGQYLYCMISKWMISDMKELNNFVNKKNYIVCTQLMM